MDEDLGERHAQDLLVALRRRGIACTLNGDRRSPPGVRIPLIPGYQPAPTTDDIVPALFVLTEGPDDRRNQRSWSWIGQVSGFDPDQDDQLSETLFTWTERTWAGETIESLVQRLEALVTLLIVGAVEYLAARPAGDHDRGHEATDPPAEM